MPFDSPRLDDRAFQDIVQEALRRIPLYTPEWTDHNLSDPGITLIELFAWMTDIILYRLNRVPDLHYIKMMELLGMKLRAPEFATTRVTFWLSAPQPANIEIPQGTEVSTTRTENNPAVIFSTSEDFTVRLAELSHVLTSFVPEGEQRRFKAQNLRRLQAGFDGTFIFQEKPVAGDAVYFGFRSDLSHHILGLDLDVDVAGGAGIDPTRPPYNWEALTNEAPHEWEVCEVDVDGTKAYNVPGLIRLHLPRLVEGEVAGQKAYWVRCIIQEPSRDVPQYRRSPLLRQAQAASWGGTIPAVHASRVNNEVLGRSNGEPGQKFNLENTPVLNRQDGEHIVVRSRQDMEEVWTEVNDFADSGPEDRHYTIDSATGEVRFGPALPQRDGSIKRYGAIPGRGAMIVMKRYRYGGGTIGNLQRGVINVLKTSIPYVATVANRQEAKGGLNLENLEDAKLRVPGYLRSLRRAVTGRDFEYLALEAARGKVARVFALQPPESEIGEVKVLLIPHVNNPEGQIAREDLEVPTDLRDTIRDYLDERRLLTTRLDVTAPAYRWVASRVRIHVSEHEDPDKVRQAVLQRLYAFINPLVGGFEGKGWPFGRDLSEFDVVSALQNVRGIDFVRSVELFPVDWRGGNATPSQTKESTIELVTHGVVVSYGHTVEVD